MKEKDHIAYRLKNFGLGGAETAVVGVLKKLKDYNNIVVTLDPLNQFGNDLQYDRLLPEPEILLPLSNCHRENCAGSSGKIKWTLYTASFTGYGIAGTRYACPKDIPLVTSIQASLTDSGVQKTGSASLIGLSYKHRPGRILGVI